MSNEWDEEWKEYEDWKKQQQDDNPDIDYPYILGDFEQEIPAVTTRIEVIDKNGKSYSNYDCDRITLSFRHEGLTLQVFIEDIPYEDDLF
tara:strand:- start:4395 stop:4664 length:270 start_codon:yes stop_codon:yes gene_type:complete